MEIIPAAPRGRFRGSTLLAEALAEGPFGVTVLRLRAA